MDLNAALNPAYVSSLKSLALKAEAVLEGTLAGRHPSPFHGFSSEFSQYKGYAPGDDMKLLDWKVYGKNDQLVTRQYRDETSARVYLILDASLSMGYGGSAGESPSKLEYCAVLAASLALTAFRQRDAVSLMHGADAPDAFLPPRNNPSHLRQVFRALEALRPSGVTDLRALLGKAAAHLKPGSMTFVFSDFWQEPEGIVAGLREIRHKHQAVTLVHALTRAEADFLDGSDLELKDLETDDAVKISARHLRPQYLETLRAHAQALRSECSNLSAKYVSLETDLSYFQAMRRVLARS